MEMEEQQFQTNVDVSVSNMERDLQRHLRRKGVDVPDPLTDLQLILMFMRTRFSSLYLSQNSFNTDTRFLVPIYL